MDYNIPPRHMKFEDIDNNEHQKEKPEPENTGGLSWLDDVDNLDLPSRTFNGSTSQNKYDSEQENNFPHSFNHARNEKPDRFHYYQNNDFDQIKSTRLQPEINIKSNNQEQYCSKNIIPYIFKISLNSLGLGKKIGEGGFSEIYESKYLTFPVAVKVIFDPKINEKLMEEFYNEIEKLFILRHPNIIQLYGISDKSPKLAVITELAQKGNLFDYLHKDSKNKIINLTFKNKITLQLISTMYYIHARGFVHRDLKTQNILLDKNLDMKMCDFGLTRKKSELNSGSGQFAGTPCYMAPELFERKYYDEKVDVFAFGTVLWEIYTQKIPYFNCETSEIKNYVIKGEPLVCGSSVPKPIANLISKCRSVKASDRPSFEEILEMNII